MPLLLVCALTLAGPAFADRWYEYYDQAERAIENERWSEAIEKINLALEAKGDSSARARTYGMNFTEYFPYFQLGIAYFHLGELDAAEQAFETEERLDAITGVEQAHLELRRYRDRIERARAEAAAEENRRARAIVEEHLSRAKRLEAEGDLEGALTELGSVLAVAPDEPVATASTERLRGELASRQLKDRRQKRAEELVAEGRGLLSEGRFEAASVRFEQALSLGSVAEAGRLLERARSELRARIEADRDAERRAQTIDDGLAAARSLESTGDLLGALGQLQTVLAIDPGHAEARALRKRLQLERTRLDERQARLDAAQGLQDEVAAHFDSGSYEKALSAANRLLALDAGSEIARSFVARAYRALNRQLLGSGTIQNFPPAIRFADFRDQQLANGLQVETVRDSKFRLTGTIFDDAPVELAVDLLHYGREVDRGEPREVLPVEGESSGQQVGGSYISEFNVSRELRPGLSLFRIVATDPLGLSSSSEYAVLYARPLHRSPWIWAGIGLAAVTAAGVGYARRVRRRNRLRKRRFNPYVAGAPVLDRSLFFGRDVLIDRVLQTIHNNSLLLFGERRIGKTSLQHHIKRRLGELDDPDYEFHPVYVDLQGTPQDRFFATLGQDVFEQLAPVLGELQPSAALADGTGYGYRELVHDLREVVKRLKARTSKRVKLVLLIDEVDELNAYDPRINQRLRSLFMKSFADSLVAVVSGVGIKKRWESEGSPWYNFFEEIEVKPFARADAVDLITRPIGGLFKIEPGAVDRVIELTDCRPYLIQKLCVALVNRMHESNRRSIHVADVEAIGRPEES